MPCHVSRLIGALCAACLAPSASGASPSEPQGYALGGNELTLGGYAAMAVADYIGHDPALDLSSLSLLLTWEGDSRWGFFGEVEVEHLVTANARDLAADHERQLALERLYVNYLWSDALQFRAGKFLTPIGRWNVIHAAPLTWTTSRPLITASTFPPNATGAMAHGVLPAGGHALQWALYMSPGEELAVKEGADSFEEAYGLRLDYEIGFGLQLGTSLANFKQQREGGQHKHLLGLDFLWQHAGWELSGEWARRSNVGTSAADEHGLYVQAVAPLADALYGIARYERFSPADASPGLNLYVGGLAWRFRPGWVSKLEYRFATDNSVGQPEGWLGSLAVLF